LLTGSSYDGGEEKLGRDQAEKGQKVCFFGEKEGNRDSAKMKQSFLFVERRGRLIRSEARERGVRRMKRKRKKRGLGGGWAKEKKFSGAARWKQIHRPYEKPDVSPTKKRVETERRGKKKPTMLNRTERGKEGHLNIYKKKTKKEKDRRQNSYLPPKRTHSGKW